MACSSRLVYPLEREKNKKKKKKKKKLGANLSYHWISVLRIYENQHLLDATEIFRKLNVHKKVRIVINLIMTSIS